MADLKRYGTPPAVEDCAIAEPPERLVTQVTQQVLSKHITTGLVPYALKRRLTNQAVVRQLQSFYADDLTTTPLSITVKGYGDFRISPNGWELEEG